MTGFLLPTRGVWLGDGAIGTSLPAGGPSPPERWNLERPEAVRALHAAYAAAGAMWSTTNTFGANPPRLAAHGLEHRLGETCAAAVRLAREGAPALPVLGSLGPTGLPGGGSWERAYAAAAAARAAAGVDAFLVETVVRLEEGLAAVRAARTCGAPVAACFTPAEDGRLADGTEPERAAAAFARAGAAVLGVNCGCGPASLLSPARRLVAAGAGPVLAAPSAGLPRVARGRARYPVPPDSFAGAAIEFIEAGVQLFAGCCGTTPAHIRAAAAAVRRQRPGVRPPRESQR